MTNDAAMSNSSGDWLRVVLLTLGFVGALGVFYAAFASIELEARLPAPPPAISVVVLTPDLVAGSEADAGAFHAQLVARLSSYRDIDVLDGGGLDGGDAEHQFILGTLHDELYLLGADVDLRSSYIGVNWSLTDARSGQVMRSGHVSAPAPFGTNGLVDAVVEDVVGVQGALAVLRHPSDDVG